MDQRSGCPINLSLEVIGDRWSLIILRDMMFGNRRSFREILTNSEEGIASNILSNRLKRLQAEGLITKTDDPSHKQKSIYRLTNKSIELLPVMVALGAWGRRYLPVTKELSIRAQILEEGGADLWDRFMTELRHIHLDEPLANGWQSVLEQLQAAYERVVQEQADQRRP